MMKRTLKITALVLVQLAVVIGVAEVAARVLIKETSDGNLLTRGRILKPYYFPKNTFKENYRQYLEGVDERPSSISLRYDPDLGWNNNPRMVDYFNPQGLRNPGRVFQKNPPAGVLRIALFGDSMTKGAEVELEESWGFYLERELRESGFNVEVLNFGVGGYGIDQIFLRWEKEGKHFHPDVVIFGFYPRDIARCLEVHHLKNWGLSPGGMGFSKPRFILSDQNGLELINSPTIPPSELVSHANRFDDLPFMEFDTVFQENREDYRMNVLRILWSGRFLEEHLARNRFTRNNYYQYDSYYDLEKDGAQIALRVLEKFHDSVSRNMGEFVVANLPMRLDLHHLKKGRPLRYSDLLERIENLAPVVRTEVALQAHPIDSLFAPGGHYSALGNEVVAEALSEYFRTQAAKPLDSD